MSKGRKKLATALKKMQGTLEKSRLIDNEMQVDLCSRFAKPVRQNAYICTSFMQNVSFALRTLL